MNRSRSLARAFTLVEMAVSLAVIGIVGGILFTSIRNVALLSAKNSAVNVTHQQSRELIHRAVQQIHAAAGIPALINTSLAFVTGNGPAAGVAYQSLANGPNRIYTGALAGATTLRVTVKMGQVLPAIGMRLNVPAFRLEENITGVAPLGGTPATYNITIATPLGSAINCTAGAPNYVAYITQRSALVVVGQTLRNYPNTLTGVFTDVAVNISTPTPFTVPGGDNRFIKADFVTRDARVTGLNLKSMDTKLSLNVPYRYRLTTRQ